MIDTGHRRCQGTSRSWPFGQTLILVFEKPVGLFGIMQDVASSFSFPKELVASFSPHRAGKIGENGMEEHMLRLVFFSFRFLLGKWKWVTYRWRPPDMHQFS